MLQGQSNVSLQVLLIVLVLMELPTSSPGVHKPVLLLIRWWLELLGKFFDMGLMHCLGSSPMSFNLSLISELLLLWQTVLTLQFPASTLPLDLMSHGCLLGYSRSDKEATGGNYTGLNTASDYFGDYFVLIFAFTKVYKQSLFDMCALSIGHQLYWISYQGKFNLR